MLVLGPPHIYEKVGFLKQDMYNEQLKQRKSKFSDAKVALDLLEGLSLEFKKCMLGDFDTVEFDCKWNAMVEEFGLEENLWVLEMHEKRHMWAMSHIRGNFFACLELHLVVKVLIQNLVGMLVSVTV